MDSRNAEYFIKCRKTLGHFYRKEILTNILQTEIHLDSVLRNISYCAESTFRFGSKVTQRFINSRLLL